ncbi:MAG: FAD-binding protein [Propionibacteriaceae bacterium]|nr:FAD-binding protein [Propionibacteriaceae bacterium]
MMRVDTVVVAGQPIEVTSARVVVVGTGAAGYCAADQLTRLGVADVIMVTDRIQAGTSRNAGSDKQTYYKLTLAGGGADSVLDMARTLFDGGAMDGDIALAEASGSVGAFCHLVEAGVPFPRNRYGEFVGYKTDHDPRQRATSAGPYTSKSMVERLQARVAAAGVPVLEGHRVVDLVTHEDRVMGVLTWDIDQGRLALFRCDFVVYATGGPAGMYADSVYPHGQWGAQGAALRAGAAAKNLTEWQFGLASVAPRWNVSGSYMQVVPRFVSTDAAGGDEREFLSQAIPDPGQLASLIFLKGYQWPYDARKAHDGSSLIDLLVHREQVLLGRRVFLDFRRNMAGFDPATLDHEARSYLAGAQALDGPTPAARLHLLNQPAYLFYRDHHQGLDLDHELLQVAVSAQHNNGGLATDCWWQSNLRGLFPIGEASGSHGVYRPGGSALNSGQVGATRAAMWIAGHVRDGLGDDGFVQAAEPLVTAARQVVARAADRFESSGIDTTGQALARIARRMSDCAGLVREPRVVEQALSQTLSEVEDGLLVDVAADSSSRRSLDRVFLLRDIVSSQVVYLAAMVDYVAHGGRSRGSVLYTDPAGQAPRRPDGGTVDLPSSYRFTTDDQDLDDVIQEARWDGRTVPQFCWRPRRSIPVEDEVFESVWRWHRATGGVE